MGLGGRWLYDNLLRCGLFGLTHKEIKCPRIDLSKTAAAAEGNRDGDCRIFALKFHSARDEQVVEFVYVQRATRFAKEQRAGLRYSAVIKTIADRLEIIDDRNRLGRLSRQLAGVFIA